MRSVRLRRHALAAALAASIPGWSSAGFYEGTVDAADLAFAFTEWTRLAAELQASASDDDAPGGDPGYFGSINTTFTYVYDYTPGASLPYNYLQDLYVTSDAGLGAEGVAVTLRGGDALVIASSFQTFRNFAISDPLALMQHVIIDTRGSDLRIDGTVIAELSLHKFGSGRLHLGSADNVWHAAPKVAEGILSGASAALQTDVLLYGGVVEFVQVTDAVHAWSVRGIGDVVKSGAGRLLLDAEQSFEGMLRVHEGVLALGASALPPKLEDVEVLADAMLDLSAVNRTVELDSLTGTGTVKLGDGGLRLDIDSAYVTAVVEAGFSGSGALFIARSQDIELRGNASQAGGTYVEVGARLNVASDQALGAVGATLVLDGGELRALADLSLLRAIGVLNPSDINTNDYAIDVAGGLNGRDSTLYVFGTGRLALHDLGTFDGEVRVGNGTLALVGDGGLAAGSRVALGDGASLDLTAVGGARRLYGFDSAYESSALLLGAHALTLAVGDEGALFAGRIEGAGDLIKIGSGKLALTGVNLGSGTLRVREGVVQATVQALGGTVDNDAELRVLVGLGEALAWDGSLGGSGTLIKEGGGLLWLRGDNTQARVHVQTGLLAGRSATLGKDIEIDADAGIAFYIDADDTHTGRIAGDGVLYSYGSGALTLSGQYEHRGGTAVSNTLRIDDDQRLGHVSGNLLLSGGTLQALANLTLRREVAIGSAGGTLDDKGHDITLDGPLTGAGDLLKAGAGRLSLSDAAGHVGRITVAEGELAFDGTAGGSFEVLAGARLIAAGEVAGDIAVRDGGELWLGDGGLLVGGAFDLSGLLAVNSAAVADLLSLRFATADIELLHAGSIVLGASARLVLDDALVRAGYRLTVDADSVNLIAAPVPEPSAPLMLSAGLALIGWRRLRRG